MENQWKLNGKSKEIQWKRMKINGNSMENQYKLYGKSMEIEGKIKGNSMETNENQRKELINFIKIVFSFIFWI